MTGSYNTLGKKEGKFIFYNEHGIIRIEGRYADNDMTGSWDFYDSAGRLSTQINCESEQEFVPTLIINKYGDTLLEKW